MEKDARSQGLRTHALGPMHPLSSHPFSAIYAWLACLKQHDPHFWYVRFSLRADRLEDPLFCLSVVHHRHLQLAMLVSCPMGMNQLAILKDRTCSQIESVQDDPMKTAEPQPCVARGSAQAST
eukprot:1644086-Rhodomonas_salina.2